MQREVCGSKEEKHYANAVLGTLLVGYKGVDNTGIMSSRHEKYATTSSRVTSSFKLLW